MYGGMKGDGSQSRELWRLRLHTLEWELVGNPGGSRGNRRGNHGNRKGGRKRNRQGRTEGGSRHRRAGGRKRREEETEECTWSSPGPCPPLASVGHSSVVVDDKYMLIIFGHSARLGYLNVVQQFHFGNLLFIYYYVVLH